MKNSHRAAARAPPKKMRLRAKSEAQEVVDFHIVDRGKLP
jgi:hypothetical protein